MADDVPPIPGHQWQENPLLDDKGRPIPCMHDGCYRYAVRIVSFEVPKHKQFFGQTHNCCSVHSRPLKTG
jgi:hypothetical protein